MTSVGKSSTPRSSDGIRCYLAGAMDAENVPRALEIAARFPQARTALSSCDDFKNGQKTPCLRTARTYAILTAPAAGWFSNVRQFGNRKSSENHCINTDLWWALVDDLRTLPLGTFSEGRDSDFNSGVGDAELFRQHRQTGISRPQFQAPDQRRRQ